MKMFKVSFVQNEKLHTVVIEAKNIGEACKITKKEYNIKAENIYEVVEI